MPDLEIVTVPQLDRRLGRQMVHDPLSRAFAMPLSVDRSLWVTKSIRIYDPIPNPNQTVGNCTMCAKAMQMNAVGNRVSGVVIGMPWAMKGYEWETANDEFPGQWKPDDTGSSGLASCKTAIHFGVGSTYRWLFGGADEVVQAIMDGHTPSIGTWWYAGMFKPDADNRIHPTGSKVGGHQYVARGYNKTRDWVKIRCWWGTYRDVWVSRFDLQALLADGGDAHVQERKRP